MRRAKGDFKAGEGEGEGGGMGKISVSRVKTISETKKRGICMAPRRAPAMWSKADSARGYRRVLRPRLTDEAERAAAQRRCAAAAAEAVRCLCHGAGATPAAKSPVCRNASSTGLPIELPLTLTLSSLPGDCACHIAAVSLPVALTLRCLSTSLAAALLPIAHGLQSSRARCLREAVFVTHPLGEESAVEARYVCNVTHGPGCTIPGTIAASARSTPFFSSETIMPRGFRAALLEERRRLALHIHLWVEGRLRDAERAGKKARTSFDPGVADSELAIVLRNLSSSTDVGRRCSRAARVRFRQNYAAFVANAFRARGGLPLLTATGVYLCNTEL